MKKIIALTVALALFASSSVFAASINIEPVGASPNGVYSVFLDGTGTNFDSVGIQILPDAGFELLNPDAGFNGFFPRGAGEEFSFINPLLGAATAQGGEGWSLPVSSFGADALRAEGGPLGSTIDTPAAPGLFLANVMLPTGGTGTYSVQIVGGGQTIETLEGLIGIPEPTTMALAGLSLIGLVATRRRS